MTITWLGQNCFKIDSKQATVLLDPPAGQMPRFSADIVVLPRLVPERERGSLKGSPFIIQSPGEFEVRGVFVEGQVFGDQREVTYRLEVEGVRFGHLGRTAKADEAAAAFLEDVDVLFVPVGGGEILGPTEAAAMVSAIEPRLVIPTHYRSAAAPALAPVEKFCQVMGLLTPAAVPKLNLSRKDLPHEETRLVILQA
jgi:L-ascorbate metabolism protein UlaG (beta-lactamase superfamily)